MPAHAAVPVATRPAWTWRLLPALAVCLAAPAFFVLLTPWLAWVLLAMGVGAALLIERREAFDRPPSTDAAGDGIRRPSLTRDLSLIAVGLLVVSVIPLKAELDNLAFLRFTLEIRRRFSDRVRAEGSLLLHKSMSLSWKLQGMRRHSQSPSGTCAKLYAPYDQ